MTRGETTYTFSSIEKEEYSKMYDFLKSKKINVKSTGKMDASKINLGEDVDHNLEKVSSSRDVIISVYLFTCLLVYL